MNQFHHSHKKSFLVTMISQILLTQKLSAMTVCEFQDVTRSAYEPMQLTAERKLWKHMIKKIPWRK